MAARRVLVAGTVADKPARLVGAGEPLVVQGAGPRFVSRGGEKLDAALSRFGVRVEGRTALDAGASTGGFTDCLLQRGAVRVYAVDVGHGQLHPSLRDDPRVVVHERTNLRWLTPDVLRPRVGSFEAVDVVTADLSFISLSVVAPVLCGPLVRTGGDLVALVKPQFEAGRVEVSRGRGVITDPEVWRRTLTEAACALESHGTGIIAAMASPLTGPAGNTEFLVHGVVGGPPAGPDALATMVEAAVAEARDAPAGR